MNQELYDLILDECGFAEGGPIFTADDSASNDLAHERAGVIMQLIEKVKISSWPIEYLP